MKETTQTQFKMKGLTKRQIRYICFRLQTEAEGGNPALPEDRAPMSFVAKVKKHMESQDDFGGWKMFAKTWDVDEKSPLVVIPRISSIYSDWNNVMKKEAKDLPPSPQATKIIELPVSPEEKKVPPRDSNGKFISKSKKDETVIESIGVSSTNKKSFWDVLK